MHRFTQIVQDEAPCQHNPPPHHFPSPTKKPCHEGAEACLDEAKPPNSRTLHANGDTQLRERTGTPS